MAVATSTKIHPFYSSKDPNEGGIAIRGPILCVIANWSHIVSVGGSVKRLRIDGVRVQWAKLWGKSMLSLIVFDFWPHLDAAGRFDEMQ